MSNLFLGVVTLAVLAGVIIFIWVMFELKKTINALKKLLDTTEHSLKPTLAELQDTLKSVRNVADHLTVVTKDLTELSGALKEVGENVRHVNRDVKQVVHYMDGVTSTAVLEASSLKAGAKAGILFLLKNLFK